MTVGALETADRVARQMARDLERRRKQLGLTRFVLSQRLSVPTGLLEEWEKGRSFPDTPSFFLWLRLLDCIAVVSAIDDGTCA